MKKYLLSFLATLVLCVPLVWASVSTDSFTRGDSGDLGAAWDVYTNACQITGFAVQPTADNTRCVEGYSTLVPGNNQYSQIKLVTANTDTIADFAVAVRLQAPTTYNGYFCRGVFGPSATITSIIQRRDGAGAGTDIASESSTSWVANDVIKCEATADIVLKRNGATLLTQADSTYTSGRGGIAIQRPSVDDVILDDFEVADLGGAVKVKHRSTGYR